MTSNIGLAFLVIPKWVHTSTTVCALFVFMPFFIRSLVGQVFNGVKVLSIHTYGVGVRTKWLCMCHCGSMFVVDGSFLKNGHTRSCGCIRDKITDIVGGKFGRLTVLSLADGSKPAKWNCRCTCGKEKIIIGSSLKNGSTRSCGCLVKNRKVPSRRIDLVGKKFNMLTVIERDETKKQRWKCLCDCGKETMVGSGSLKTGKTKSCGCYNLISLSINKRTHGMAADHNRIYAIWNGMRKRCYNSKDSGYSRYGGRGISICDEWRNDCTAFVKWSLANGYEDHLSIDRRDNDGNYTPNNCRWVSMIVQQQNTSRTLGEEKVREIRELLKSGVTQLKIAAMYGINNGAISNINTGKTYKNIS